MIINDIPPKTYSAHLGEIPPVHKYSRILHQSKTFQKGHQTTELTVTVIHQDRHTRLHA